MVCRATGLFLDPFGSDGLLKGLAKRSRAATYVKQARRLATSGQLTFTASVRTGVMLKK
jgi:hypothetical protein